MSQTVVDDVERPARDEPMRRRWMSPPHLALVAIAGAYTAAVFLRTSQSMALTWDEVIYASEVVPEVPSVDFDAARSRGMPLLLAPVAFFTPSIFVLRVYLTLLAGVLLYAAFRPWIALIGERNRPTSYAPAIAAGLFTTLWMSILYGTMAYPNLWLAFFLTAGIGGFCLIVQRHGIHIGAVLTISAAFAVATLIRPVDTAAAAIPLLGVAVAVKRFRLPAAILVPVVGVGIGLLAWIVEAYVRFAGPLERLRQGAAMNEGGLTWSLTKHINSLDGPYILCRPPEICDGGPLTGVLWVVVLPVLVLFGLLAARRSQNLTSLSIATSSALGLAVPYLLLFDYANPRFLLPTFALLVLPVAYGITRLIERSRSWARIAISSIAVVAVLAHVGVQQTILDGVNEHILRISNEHTTQAMYLRDVHGVRPPCLYVGLGSIVQSYLLHCRARYAEGGAIASNEARIQEALAEEYDVVIRLKADDQIPAFMSDWRRISLPLRDDYVAYLPPD